MEPCNGNLLKEEMERNQHGPMCVFNYSSQPTGEYSAPEYFPSFLNHSVMKLVDRNDILVPMEELNKGLCSGAKLDVHFPGFPTLRYIEHTGKLSQAKVNLTFFNVIVKFF